MTGISFWQGIFSIQQKQKKVMLQGVHELYELDETSESWADHEPRINRLVFIGKIRYSLSVESWEISCFITFKTCFINNLPFTVFLLQVETLMATFWRKNLFQPCLIKTAWSRWYLTETMHNLPGHIYKPYNINILIRHLWNHWKRLFQFATQFLYQGCKSCDSYI